MPDLDWSGKRCGHNYLPSECPHARCGYRESLGEVERLREQLKWARLKLLVMGCSEPPRQPQAPDDQRERGGGE